MLHEAIATAGISPGPAQGYDGDGRDPVARLRGQAAGLLGAFSAAGPTGWRVAIWDRELTVSMVAVTGALEITVHGFRSAFRDWAAETTGYPNHVIEMALAHAIGDKVEASYRRGDLFSKRTRLMADWAKFCMTRPADAAGNVVAMRAGA